MRRSGFPRMGRAAVLACVSAVFLVLTGCADGVTTNRGDQNPLLNLECSIPRSEIFDGGVPVDGIPALSNPEFVEVGDPSMAYLDDTPGFPDPRVIGLVVDGQAYAVPHNILWWHEIVNLDLPGGVQVAVTYCPLTGSSLVFDRARVGGAELGVSGLIFQNNLIMFDRNAERSLFPQMERGARCGPADGMQLEMFPAMELRWSAWRDLHPNTLVVSDATGIDREYNRYPYGSYEQSRDLLFPQSVPGPGEERRPMKERLLGLPAPEEDSEGGLAVPFGELSLAADQGVAAVHVDGPLGDALVLWNTGARGAMAFRPRTLEGERVEVQALDGRFVDQESGSEWTLDGRAISGPMSGARLQPIAEAYVAFWFAWEAFHPETDIWLR